MKPKVICITVAVVLTLIATAPAAAQTPVGTAFTYQGQLKQGGLPVTNTADFQFNLWDAATTPPGVQVGTTQSVNGATVTNGLFTVTLDFGASAFTGDARWLEIAVRSPAGSGSYTTLTPRQELTPAPYTQYALAPWTTGASGVLSYTGGNVGISTVNPVSPLHVVGNTWDQTVIKAEHPGGSYDPAIAGYHNSVPSYGVGVRGEGGYRGMEGYVYPTSGTDQYTGMFGYVYGTGSANGTNTGTVGMAQGAGTNYGVQGLAGSSSTTNYGVYGAASGYGTNYGVYGTALAGTTNWAGYFAGAVNATDGIVTGQGASGGGTRWGNIKVRGSVTFATVYKTTLEWDFSNYQVKLTNTSTWEYCHFAGHKWEGGTPTFVYGYGAPSATTVLATLDSNGEYLIVDIASSAGDGHIHIYCYYDNQYIVANYTYRYD